MRCLVDIGKEGPVWLEWCAALYESYAADTEAIGAQRWESSTQYARAAHELCEELENFE